VGSHVSSHYAPGGIIFSLYHYALGGKNVSLFYYAPGGNNFSNKHFSPMHGTQKQATFLDSLGILLNKGAIIAELVGVI
jgi:hypothetical protein